MVMSYPRRPCAVFSVIKLVCAQYKLKYAGLPRTGQLKAVRTCAHISLYVPQLKVTVVVAVLLVAVSIYRT